MADLDGMGRAGRDRIEFVAGRHHHGNATLVVVRSRGRARAAWMLAGRHEAGDW